MAKTFQERLDVIADMAEKSVSKDTLTTAVNEAVDAKTVELNEKIAEVKSMVEALADAADGKELSEEVTAAISNLTGVTNG